MNPSNAWALLTARSASLSRSPGGFQRLRPEDVEAMLGGLAREPFLMGMAYECHDVGSMKQLELRLWTMINAQALTEEWKLPAGQFVTRRLAGLALYESLDPALCPHCLGKGTTSFSLFREPHLILSPYFEQLNPFEGRTRCVVCHASGRVKMTGRKRAELAGVNKDTWPRYWAARYEPWYFTACGWLADARSHLARALKKHTEELVA